MVAAEPRRVDVEYQETPCRSAINRVHGMGFKWSLNPYTGCEHRCAFCYVRAFELRADRPGDDRYGRSVRVKVNVASVLDQELSRRSWRRELVAVGTATDPYQPAEGRYKLTRACLKVFGRHANPVGIITRGPMIIRDLDVLTELARHAEVTVNFSIPTLDEVVWRRTEPGTAPPRQRLRALQKLVDAGIKAGVGMAPILPGLSDRPEQLEAVVVAARAAGATHLWASILHLKPGTKEHFLEVLGRHWPDQLPRYEQLYRARPYLGKEHTEPTLQVVSAFRVRHAISDRRPDRDLPPSAPEPQQLAIAFG
ncbi:MAG TPA: radical SAM protein [Candidatus Dormibacteraeota bacterium]